MDLKTNLALKKKRELLGSLNKRKMSLRKYIDNLKQNECRQDITQITKCVFLGSLCLKPAPQLFDSPTLLAELDMTVGNIKINNTVINDENVSNPHDAKTNGKVTVKNNFVKKANTKRKSLNPPKPKKKSLREKNEPNCSINKPKKKFIIEIEEPIRLEDMKISSLSSNSMESNLFESPPITQEKFGNLIVSALNTAIDEDEVASSETDIIDDEIILNQDDPLEEINPHELKKTIPEDITCEEDERLKREPTPELILSDSDDDAIDQLMFNIRDIKICPNGAEKDFFAMTTPDIEAFEQFSNNLNNPKLDEYQPEPVQEVVVTNNENLKIEYEEHPVNINNKIPSPPIIREEETTSPQDIDKHNNKRTPQCKICSQVFQSYAKLKKHKLTHNGDKPYYCLKCGDNHTTLDQLIAHLRTHEGKRPYVCKKCNKDFKTKRSLENHQPVHVLRKVVAPKKVFKCEVCWKEFRKLCDLERHTRVHTGEKPSVCNICNRRFQQAHNLNKHLLIHTQEKPFQCDICNKKFGRNDVLNRHLLTHSVKKPNDCEICCKSFIRVSQLLAHKEKYHS